MTVYVTVAHEDPQNDGTGRISLPVLGVYEDLRGAREVAAHTDTTTFELRRDEARALVDDFEHDVKKSAHGMWCHTCSKTVAHYKDSVERFDCPNQPDVDFE